MRAFLYIAIAVLGMQTEPCLAEGFGAFDFFGTGNTVLRAGAQRQATDINFIAVGRAWDSSGTVAQYKSLLASYRVSNGAQDLNFALGGTFSGKKLIDLGGAGYDNLCSAVVYGYDGFIAACRSMLASGYYDTYLVKFDNSGNLNSNFGTNGIVATGIGGTLAKGHAMPRGISYNSSGGTLANGGVVAVVGTHGFYSPGVFHPYIALFDQKTGAQVGTTVELAGVSGTAVAVTSDASTSAIGNYYMLSTDTSANHNFYISRFDGSLNASASPWGDAIDFSAAGGGADSVPTAIVMFGSDVVAVGSNRSGTNPWACAAAARNIYTGNLDTGFGSSTISGGVNNQGITLFTPNASYDCIANAVAVGPLGGLLYLSGTAHNGTNYDYLSAEIDGTGTLISTYGTSGIKVQASGPADDVLNFALFAGNDGSRAYGVGRSLNSSLYNGGAVTSTTTTTPSGSSDSWTAITTTGAPSARDSYSAVWTGSKMIVWGGTDGTNYFNDGGLYDPVANSWSPTTTVGAPIKRVEHTVVWTGSKMIIWGGWQGTSASDFNDGGIYDPVANTWTATTTVGAPIVRSLHSTVWTGSKMIVWGGTGTSAYLNTGGVYDPSTNTWTSTTTANAPSIRYHCSAVWTGSQMIIWGGGTTVYLNDGRLYNPTSDTWTTMTTTNAPAKRFITTAIWTGTQMIVWGDGPGASTNAVNSGGRYDPVGNVWLSTTTTGAPSARIVHGTIWTGSKMIVWGGLGSGVYANTGGAYDPIADSWTSTTTASAPAARNAHATVWTGSKMIVFGGDNNTYFNNGGIYSPVSTSGTGGSYVTKNSNVWSAVTTTGAPSVRGTHTAVWTGTKLAVWGGYSGSYLGDGYLYDPVANSWSAMASTGAPSVRNLHVAAWSGSKMFIWGGYSSASGGKNVNSGALYDPVANTWSTTSTTGVLTARINATATWTGSKMLVWGGDNGSGASPVYYNDGGLYDPVGNTWTSVTTTGAPAGRSKHTSVWTGSKLIIWGGSYSDAGGNTYSFNDGALYDPSTNSWTSVTTTGAPSIRDQHVGVWTGSKMIIWGGTGIGVNTGGIYDPTMNSWTATTITGAPTARTQANAAWTGYRMVVFGGVSSGASLNSGGVFDPVTNSWTTATTTGAPTARRQHTATWSGSGFIVWGGFDGSTTYYNDGAMYSP